MMCSSVLGIEFVFLVTATSSLILQDYNDDIYCFVADIALLSLLFLQANRHDQSLFYQHLVPLPFQKLFRFHAHCVS